jgi:hypothetical protein
MPYIHTMHLSEPRLPELLLASIMQAKIILTTIVISQERGIKNHYHFIPNPAVRWRKGGIQ